MAGSLHLAEVNIDGDEFEAILPGASPPKASQTDDNPSRATSIDVHVQQADPTIDYAEWKSKRRGLSSKARVTEDGRISVSLNLSRKLPDLPKDYARNVQEFGLDETEWHRCPAMNIVIMIVGSRGDVQPYVALGRELSKDGHRVRIATHATFRSFVTDAGLEFFDIGGNPQDLMSYMVKNPGLMPGFASLTSGDIGRKRKMLAEMIHGCWHSCHAPCPTSGRAFAADAIISNPPAFAHIHCAQALGIPLLLSFTMPWSPTAAFPHPLVNIRRSNMEVGLRNILSYAMAELLTWQGIGDIVNDLRTHSLGLPRLSLRSGPGLVDRAKVPWTYCMSPALVPKPDDWKNHIDVVGFYFLDLAKTFTPADDLAVFLAAGEPPVYIGFGSVVVENPALMTQTIFEATAQAGVRALVSAGWGGLGSVSVPPHVFIIGNVPHDWLFDNERVSAVVHHGGAGTTAAGLSKGRPTVVVPFFGDQGFWGDMVHRSGAGPQPIPHKKLNVENLRDAIKFAISPPAKVAAGQLADRIRSEDGVRSGVKSFYRHLPLLNMRCDLDSSRIAVWWSAEHCLKLSGFAAQTLADAKHIELAHLDIHRAKEYDERNYVNDALAEGIFSVFWFLTHSATDIIDTFRSPVQGLIYTTTLVPRGVMNAVIFAHNSVYNAPILYGSDIRPPGEVTNLTSGIRAAGRELLYGLYDAVTGLVREPVAGAKSGGFVGAMKGTGRGIVNVAVRPIAAVLGVFANPLLGAKKSLKSVAVHKEAHTIRSTRISDGEELVRNSTAAERSEIFKRFEEAKLKTDERRQHYKEAVQEHIRKNAAAKRKLDSAVESGG